MTAVDPGRWQAIDQAYTKLLDSVPADRRWLLMQTLVSGGPRRALAGALPIQPGATILDVGCGFGASALELAALDPARVLGVDVDRPVLAVAAEAASMCGLRSTVAFFAGDAYELPFADASVDVVFSRFVFQHLADPSAAAGELTRVLRLGGLACVVDVDDGLSISEPPPSPAFSRLAAALRASQAAYGGDRYIGRRLAGVLDRSGLEPASVLVLPQAAYTRPDPGGPERRLLLERLQAARDAIVAGGHMGPGEFDRDLDALAREEPGSTCEIEAHLAVVARRR